MKVSKYYLTDDSGDYVEYMELIRYYNNEVQYEPLIDAITNGARIIY